MQEKYWFIDNWHGEKKEFETLKQAERAAKKEMGSVTIFYGPDLIKNVSGEGYYA